MRNPSTVSKTSCCSKVGIKRGPWTREEDEILVNYINREGEGRWRTLPKRAGLLRCGKSCRLRWMNYLRPSVKRGHIAPDEEDLILRLHRLLGNRWSLIAGRIPGRTDNEIKNYWNTHLSKKLINQGIDPRTHKPLILYPSSPQNTGPELNPNRNPDSLPSEQTGGCSHTLVVTEPSTNQLNTTTCNEAQEASPGSMRAVFQSEEDNDVDNSNEDLTLSTFLDSLINDENIVLNYQQKQQPVINHHHLFAPLAYNNNPLVTSSAQNFNPGTHAAGWEAEILSAMVNTLDTTDHEQNVYLNHTQ